MRTTGPALLVALLLAGCVPNQAWRSTAGICAEPECRTGSIERYAVNTQPPAHYMIGVVEFDDQGLTYDPAQMDALFTQLKAESAEQDLCLVVFVHGWEHNARFDDPNVQGFRALLERLTRTEAEHPRGAWNRPRKIIGIYAGWRGQSLDAGVLSDLTFWNRKDAAWRVALGSIRELLGRARALRDTIDRTTWSGHLVPAGTAAPPGERLRSTRLLTIGHSFGGLIVYTALAQSLIDRAATSAMASALGDAADRDKLIPGYGDLTVIINPAVEAVAFEPVRRIVQAMRAQDYARDQPPVLVEVTSSADWATGIAFPLGRWFDTATENFVNGRERWQAQAALGHYEPFWTHDLTSAPHAETPEAAAAQRTRLAQASPADADAEARALVAAECAAHARFEATWRHDGYLAQGWTRRYSAGAVLTQRAGSAFDANDPYWFVRADASVIPDHSTINRPVFVDFIRQLYDELLLAQQGCH